MTWLLAHTLQRSVRDRGPPSRVQTKPPASVTMRLPAAWSQGQRLYSKNRSVRPQATLHRSSAAAPRRRKSQLRRKSCSVRRMVGSRYSRR